MGGIYLNKAGTGRAPEIDVFADRSSLVLEWLLMKGRRMDSFRLRELAAETGVSLGLAQRVLAEMVRQGLVTSRGVRTAKIYTVQTAPKNTQKLMSLWGEAYRLPSKCRSYTYSSGLQGWQEIVETLEKSKLRNAVALALHSAVRAHGFRFANLEGVELYLLDPQQRPAIEKLLKLEPRERGYEVLLFQPYYKAMLKRKETLPELSWPKPSVAEIRSASPLLTYLDLMSFPLRGQEQAEYLLENVESLKGLR